MSVGYEGFAIFDTDISGNGTTFLCTSASVPNQRQRIDSSAGIKGDITTLATDATSQIGLPHYYDWSSNDGSFGFEATANIIQGLKDWIFGRSASKRMGFSPAGYPQSWQLFPDCFWTSISFSATEGSAITGSFDFTCVAETVTRTYGNNYLNNRLGTIETNFGSLTPAILQNEVLGALNPSGEQKIPIPYYKGTLSSENLLGPDLARIAEPISWTITFTQEIQKQFACTASTDFYTAKAPIGITIGPMNIEFQVELYLLNSSYTIPQDPLTLTLTIDDIVFLLQQMELQQSNQEISGQGNVTNLSLSYSVYGLLSQAA